MIRKKPVEPIYQSIGRRIANRRRDLWMTQKQVAERSRVAIGRLSEIENGTQRAHLTTLARIAAVLGMNYRDLFDGEEVG